MGSRVRRPTTASEGQSRSDGRAPGSLRTDSGAFSVRHEAAPHPGAGRAFCGSSILVEFAAQHPVVGEFSLVQAVRSTQVSGGTEAPILPRPGTSDASITTDDGWRIDSPTSNHPAYGSEGRRDRLDAPGERPLEDVRRPTPEAALDSGDSDQWLRDHPMSTARDVPTDQLSGEAQEGFRHVSGGRASRAPAILRDEPGVAGRGPTGPVVHQRFETTALLTSGPMSGTYLGSIAWGHDIDERGQVTLVRATVESRGAPSDTFGEAAQEWNQGTSVQGPTIDLPLPR